MAFCFMSMPVSAAAKIADVQSDYWAAKEINEVVCDKIMTLSDNGNFMPEQKMTRVEFVNALLKLLNNNDALTIKNKFTDVNSSTQYFENILRSEQIGLVYGYPDRTFKPNKVILRSETQSVVSHITADKTADASVLKNFIDSGKIPGWAKNPYAKSVHYGIYVNHPNKNELRPNDELTRAEAAVLLAILKSKLALVKDKYHGKEQLLATEHLDVKRNAPNDEVKITNLRNIIVEGNVLAVAFNDKFKSEEHKAGDKVTFTTNCPISTVEGTLLIPEGSVFDAQVLDVTCPQWFNKNARVYMQLNKVTFPDGRSFALNAKPFYKDCALKEKWWMNAGKVALYTVAGGAIGTGAGVGLAFIPSPDKIGTGIAIGAPVGAAIGLVTGLVTPGLEYHAKCAQEIFVILLEDASITKN